MEDSAAHAEPPRATDAPASGLLQPEHLVEYLRGHGHPGAELTALRPLGADDTGVKAYGYGAPLHVTFRDVHGTHDVVVRTMAADPFGHERRADRVAQMVLAYDTFGSIPQHIVPLDAGTVAADGRLVSMGAGEGFLVTNFVQGEVYAVDLERLAGAALTNRDRVRCLVLADYLAELHAEVHPVDEYRRHLRDTVGSGEGIFGLCDNYPVDCAVAGPARLEALERAAVTWRWRLSSMGHRARRVHGDFHPFNLLFREPAQLAVLDCSRGGAGEPADDVTCLAVNYLFFGLLQGSEDFSEGPCRRLWDLFWSRYLERSGDTELLQVVAPFSPWRTLVLASPVWYPDVPDALRDRLLRFAEALLAGAPFEPARVEELLR